MNLLHLEQRSFDKNNHSTVGENTVKISTFPGLFQVFPDKYSISFHSFN